jgi:hypothetical protein
MATYRARIDLSTLGRDHAPGRRDDRAGPYPLETLTMKAVDVWLNSDGSWTARIFSQTFTGTHEECVAWLRASGEQY